MDNIYIKFERKENEKYRKKIFVLIIAASAIFVGIFAIFSDFKEKEQEEKMSIQISNKNEQQAQMVCKNEKIIKKTLMEAIYYRTGFNYYQPVIILENGKILEVNKEQFEKAVEGNECRTVFH